MKKIIAILGVLTIGAIGILTQMQVRQNQVRDYERQIIKIEPVFERDLEVNALIEYLASIERMDYNKEKERYIGTSRDSGVVQITLSGVEDQGYYQQVEKIERVLELEGLVDLVYGEAQLAKEEAALELLKDWESVGTQKYYDQALVGISTTKVPEGTISSSKMLSIVIPSETLQDDKYSQLADKLCEEGYSVRDLTTGGNKQVLILENKSKLLDLYTEKVWIEENEESTQQVPVDVRYEILADNAQVQGIRMIVKSHDTLRLTEEDKQVFLNAAAEMGLEDEQAQQLTQLIDQTIKQPSKAHKAQIGKWKYKTHYEKDEYGTNFVRQGLEITLYE